MPEKVMEGSKSVIWKDMYSNEGVVKIISRLCIRQEKMLKGLVLQDHKRIIGLNLAPSKVTIDSVPYLLKADYENLIESVVEFSDYIGKFA